MTVINHCHSLVKILPLVNLPYAISTMIKVIQSFSRHAVTYSIPLSNSKFCSRSTYPITTVAHAERALIIANSVIFIRIERMTLQVKVVVFNLSEGGFSSQ